MVIDLKLVKPHPQYECSFRTGFDELTTPSDQFAWIYLGEVAGGHIGYITRPSARNKGVAGEMLRQILATEKAKSISSLLVTCDDDNIASEKTIIRAGGVLESIIELAPDKPRKKRFWFHLRNKKPEQEPKDVRRVQQ